MPTPIGNLGDISRRAAEIVENFEQLEEQDVVIAVSPTRRPNTALPTGDSSEIFPSRGDDSVEPTIR